MNVSRYMTFHASSLELLVAKLNEQNNTLAFGKTIFFGPVGIEWVAVLDYQFTPVLTREDIEDMFATSVEGVTEEFDDHVRVNTA